jgi:multiple sugar transport system ATP-binding protein
VATIRLENIYKTYTGSQPAVSGLDLEITDGELVVLVGPSGCGKSTVLRLVAGLETPTRGRVFLGEHDVTTLPPQDRNIAMVFQNYALYPHKSVRENLMFGLRMRSLSNIIITERVERIATTLGITPLLDRRPAQLSGGQRQRVALGRALVREPHAFLFDEPLSNLDVKLRIEMRAELARLHRRLGATMLYVTHDQEEAMTLGSRVAVLHNGRLQQIAPPLDVYRRPVNVFVAGFLGSPTMNFVHGELEEERGSLRFRCSAFVLTLSDFHRLHAQDRNVVLGVRPQDVEVVSPPEADVTARIDIIESRGNDLVLHLELPAGNGGHSLTIVASLEENTAIDDRVDLRFRRDRLHFFDPDSGVRLTDRQ